MSSGTKKSDPNERTVRFKPTADGVLIKLDTRPKSQIDLEAGKPKAYPSGRVVAVGEGMFLQGIGFKHTVEVGAHVALSRGAFQAMESLPLTTNPEDCYVVTSEANILGILDGADFESAWFESQIEQKRIISTAH